MNPFTQSNKNKINIEEIKKNSPRYRHNHVLMNKKVEW